VSGRAIGSPLSFVMVGLRRNIEAPPDRKKSPQLQDDLRGVRTTKVPSLVNALNRNR
jgi:hypothetical protein